MDYIFILFLLIGALGIQFANGWLSKNQFNLTNFLMLVPLFLIAQYFIGLGYHEGTAQSNFIAAHVAWVGVLIIGTLVANYIFFQNIPNTTSLIALLLSAAALAIAGLK